MTESEMAGASLPTLDISLRRLNSNLAVTAKNNPTIWFAYINNLASTNLLSTLVQIDENRRVF